MHLSIPIAESVSTLDESLTFLTRVGTKVKGNAEPEALIMVAKVNQCLVRDQKGQMGTIKNMLEEIDAKLDEVDSVGQVHKEYYKSASEYYKIQGDHTSFYKVKTVISILPFIFINGDLCLVLPALFGLLRIG